MTIQTLRKICAAYLQIPIGDLVVTVDEATNTTIDLLLTAANNAKEYAENQFDWNFEETLVYLDTDKHKGVWKSAFRASDDTAVIVKQPQTFYIQNDEGYRVPLYHHSKKHGAVTAKERLKAYNYTTDRRYLDDAQELIPRKRLTNFYSDQYEVFILGQEFELNPQPEENKRIYMDALVRANEYTADDDTDFFLEYGGQYMQWATIVELNHLFKIFIPQQEGNLSPPTRMRDDALTGLLEYNNFIVQSGRQPE